MRAAPSHLVFCDGLSSVAQVGSSPTEDDLEPVATLFKELDPDIVVGCVYASACTNWVRQLRALDYMPRAQVFTVCVGSDDFGEDVGDDAAYMLGVSPWDKSLDMTDSVTGWTAREFYDNFESFSGESATYHAASAAASLNVAVLAMEASTCLALWFAALL